MDHKFIFIHPFSKLCQFRTIKNIVNTHITDFKKQKLFYIIWIYLI